VRVKWAFLGRIQAHNLRPFLWSTNFDCSDGYMAGKVVSSKTLINLLAFSRILLKIEIQSH